MENGATAAPWLFNFQGWVSVRSSGQPRTGYPTLHNNHLLTLFLHLPFDRRIADHFLVQSLQILRGKGKDALGVRGGSNKPWFLISSSMPPSCIGQLVKHGWTFCLVFSIFSLSLSCMLICLVCLCTLRVTVGKAEKETAWALSYQFDLASRKDGAMQFSYPAPVFLFFPSFVLLRQSPFLFAGDDLMTYQERLGPHVPSGGGAHGGCGCHWGSFWGWVQGWLVNGVRWDELLWS